VLAGAINIGMMVHLQAEAPYQANFIILPEFHQPEELCGMQTADNTQPYTLFQILYFWISIDIYSSIAEFPRRPEMS
jgi:hypothetical protein